MTTQQHHGCYWEQSAQGPTFPSLSGTMDVDVAVVGAGIVGVTTARLLKDAGMTVALIEALEIGHQATGRSTAKVTSQHGLMYHTLADKFSEHQAQLYASAQEHGLATIRRLVAEHAIECDLESAAAYTYTCDQSQIYNIEREVELTRRLGLPASYVRTTELPFAIAGAIRFDDQARFHPAQYLKGLAATIPGEGCHVFADSPVTAWQSGRVDTPHGHVNARHVVMATHLPLGNTGGYYMRAFPQAEPVVAARIPATVAESLQGMYVNVENPRYSIRTHINAAGDPYAIVAGSAFKPGHVEDERRHFNDIESWLRTNFQAEPAAYRWVNQDYTSMDSVPYVGWSTSLGDPCLVATGFAAWGITNGSAAASILCALLTGGSNPWLELFDAKRIRPLAGASTFVKETASVAHHFVSGHLSSRPGPVDALARNEAAVMKIDDRKVAAYRDEHDHLHVVSATCTHLGCVVGWNEADRTWDCPCHGSRFDHDGTVLHGPAVKPLEHYTPSVNGKHHRG